MKKILPLIFISLLALIFIFYKYHLIPKNLAFDEVEFAKLALSLDNKPYIVYSTLATGHSTLYFYILLTSLKLFGINTFALRLPAAVFGILSVMIFYLIIKKIFQQKYFPFFLSFILLSSHWFLNFARFSFEATFLLFLELVSIYFLIKTIIPFLRKSPGAPLGVWRSKKTVSSFDIIFSGIFSGFAFLSYTPGRIFFLLPLFFIISMSLRGVKRRSNLNSRDCFAIACNDIMKSIFYFLIPFIIITAPLNIYFLNNKDTRIDQQFFLKNNEMPIQEKLNGLWHNISSTALMFNVKGDVNGRHNYPNKPALNPILGILFIIGLIMTMKSTFAKTSADKQWNNFNNRLFLFYFFLSVFPTLMTYPWENPNMLRTYTVLPSVIYFIGSALIILDAAVSKIIPSKKKIISYFFFLVILFSCLYEIRTYFKYQSVVFNQSFEIKLPLEKAIKVKLKL